jgi:hypothetical protein
MWGMGLEMIPKEIKKNVIEAMIDRFSSFEEGIDDYLKWFNEKYGLQ